MDAAQRAVRRRDFLAGVRDGVPIGLGYLAVAFSLGIAARSAGLISFSDDISFLSPRQLASAHFLCYTDRTIFQIPRYSMKKLKRTYTRCAGLTALVLLALLIAGSFADLPISRFLYPGYFTNDCTFKI